MNWLSWLTSEQIKGQIRQILPFFAGIAVAFGYLKADQVAALTDNISNILTAAGSIAVSVSVIWSAISKTKTSIIASAAALPEVSKVVVSTPALVDAMPAVAQGTVITEREDRK